MTSASQRASAHGAALRDAKRPPDRLVVLDFYRSVGTPMSADECARRLGWRDVRARKRVSDLKRDGLLIETGALADTVDGGRQAVMRVAEPGAQLGLFE